MKSLIKTCEDVISSKRSLINAIVNNSSIYAKAIEISDKNHLSEEFKDVLVVRKDDIESKINSRMEYQIYIKRPSLYNNN